MLSQHAASSPPTPLFSLFYSQPLPSPNPSSPDTAAESATTQDDLFIMPPLGMDPASATVLTASADWAARVAEETVRSVTGDEEVWEKEAGGRTRDVEDEE